MGLLNRLRQLYRRGLTWKTSFLFRAPPYSSVFSSGDAVSALSVNIDNPGYVSVARGELFYTPSSWCPWVRRNTLALRYNDAVLGRNRPLVLFVAQTEGRQVRSDCESMPSGSFSFPYETPVTIATEVLTGCALILIAEANAVKTMIAGQVLHVTPSLGREIDNPAALTHEEIPTTMRSLEVPLLYRCPSDAVVNKVSSDWSWYKDWSPVSKKNSLRLKVTPADAGARRVHSLESVHTGRLWDKHIAYGSREGGRAAGVMIEWSPQSGWTGVAFYGPSTTFQDTKISEVRTRSDIIFFTPPDDLV